MENNNKTNNTKSIIIAVIAVVMIAAVAAGGTYAWWSWSSNSANASENTEINFRRKGGTNYNLLSKRTANIEVDRKGERIEDLDNYTFIKVPKE